MNAPKNPPAFPSGKTFSDDGMALRDWFASQALPKAIDWHTGSMGIKSHDAAALAYRIADAMMEEKERRDAGTGS